MPRRKFIVNKSVSRSKNSGVLEFNEDARREFLTGFHKRKLERKKKGEEIKIAKAKARRRQERKMLQAVPENSSNRLRENLDENNDETEEEESSDEQPAQDEHEDSNKPEKIVSVFSYESGDLLTTVTTSQVTPKPKTQFVSSPQPKTTNQSTSEDATNQPVFRSRKQKQSLLKRHKVWDKTKARKARKKKRASSK